MLDITSVFSFTRYCSVVTDHGRWPLQRDDLSEVQNHTRSKCDPGSEMQFWFFFNIVIDCIPRGVGKLLVQVGDVFVVDSRLVVFSRT